MRERGSLSPIAALMIGPGWLRGVQWGESVRTASNQPPSNIEGFL